MKTRIVFAVCLVAMLSSCIYTFYPLYSTDKLIDVTGLHGSFSTGDSEGMDREIWTFSRSSKGAYDLLITQGEKEGKLAMHIVQLGGEYFVDIVPEEFSSEMIPEFVLWNLMPVYTIGKLTPVGDNFQLQFFDPTWLEEKLSSHKIRIAHEVRRKAGDSASVEFILLTANTDELQKFVEKYAHHDEAFDNDNITELTRLAIK